MMAKGCAERCKTVDIVLRCKLILNRYQFIIDFLMSDAGGKNATKTKANTPGGRDQLWGRDPRERMNDEAETLTVESRARVPLQVSESRCAIMCEGSISRDGVGLGAHTGLV